TIATLPRGHTKIMRSLALSLSNNPLFSTSASDEVVYFCKLQSNRYVTDEGQAQISALHLIEARELRMLCLNAKVDPAAVFVCFLQAWSEEYVCKLALA
ncbi:hypothetical protein HID58_028264, partial [Brassica napus]